MQITYTGPTRSIHYPYAEALNSLGVLHAFVSGFPRISPRSPLPGIGSKLKRRDVFQTLYVGTGAYVPAALSRLFLTLSNSSLDRASYKWAKQSDVFLYYRTQGLSSCRRLHKENSPTLCVMDEVNSHVQVQERILKEEYARLGLGAFTDVADDRELRLKAYDESDYILCPSEFVRRSFLSQGFAGDRLIKVNFGFPVIEPKTESAEKPGSKPFRMLYVGQINYRKGLSYAIDAFRRVECPGKEFVIVGPKTSITGLEKTTIPDGVTFTGALKGEALDDQYRQASVFVLPSIEEGLALVQGEALSFGLPLLITTSTGGEDLINDGVEGFIVPPSDSDALRHRLQEMTDDRELLHKMSAAAVQKARALGGWDAAAQNLVSSLKSIIVARSANLRPRLPNQ